MGIGKSGWFGNLPIVVVVVVEEGDVVGRGRLCGRQRERGGRAVLARKVLERHEPRVLDAADSEEVVCGVRDGWADALQQQRIGEVEQLRNQLDAEGGADGRGLAGAALLAVRRRQQLGERLFDEDLKKVMQDLGAGKALDEHQEGHRADAAVQRVVQAHLRVDRFRPRSDSRRGAAARRADG
eukprot:2568324-Pleurochrysis_carterae.AAC.1